MLGAPQFDRVTFRLPGGKSFAVTAKGLSDENKYVASVSLDSAPVATNVVRHADVIRGGELKFAMRRKGGDL